MGTYRSVDSAKLQGSPPPPLFFFPGSDVVDSHGKEKQHAKQNKECLVMQGRGGSEEEAELIKPCSVYLVCLPHGAACTGRITAALRSPAYI